jgi:hypothetical protein
MIVPKVDWVDIVSQLAAEQEWSNFKNEAARHQGTSGRDYVRALHEVWSAMSRLQELEGGPR